MIDLRQAIATAIVAGLIIGLITRSRKPKTPIWAIMGFAAAVAVLTGLEPIEEVGNAIDVEVILFLIGMFSLVGLAEESGLLALIAYQLLSRTSSLRGLCIVVSLVLGLLAAVAVNDTVALMIPPIIYFISKASSKDPAPLFLLGAFAITIGSVMTPIGNPQNLLIAVESGLKAPFIYFALILGIPTLINLIVTPLIVMKMYGLKNDRINLVTIPHEYLKNRRDAYLSGILLASTVIALVVNDILSLLGMPYIEHRGFIPFIAASIGYILSNNPRETLSKVDWGTILFFITMFITMDGVWRSGLLQSMLSYILPYRANSYVNEYVSITISSLLLSQILSNVPFVKLFITYMHSIGYKGQDIIPWLTLAMASTIAGNLTLLGAASNIIIIESLERKYGKTITFKEFFKTGSIVTIVNTAIYTPFILLSSLFAL